MIPMRTQVPETRNFVNCLISPGFFDDEFYINVGPSSAIVDKDYVDVQVAPRGLTEGSGTVFVYVVERSKDQILIEIPGQSVVGGLRTWVHQNLVATK